MNIIAIFVLGILIGWLIEWVMDWFYWRGRINSIASENTKLRERILSLEEEINKRPEPASLTPLTDRDGNDNLQLIKGIGPAFSKRLKEAGIHTFEQLSHLTPKEMEEILGTLFKRFFSKENTIIAQAKGFAEQKRKATNG
jgi:predicted flap endonuclease-1-like 5' DNA nuclease